jgi:hypothetical protein
VLLPKHPISHPRRTEANYLLFQHGVHDAKNAKKRERQISPQRRSRQSQEPEVGITAEITEYAEIFMSHLRLNPLQPQFASFSNRSARKR